MWPQLGVTAVGIWLMAAPAKASSVLAGLLVLALAPQGRPDPERFGGGWRSLVGPGRGARD
jgi:hypothetical protein